MALDRMVELKFTTKEEAEKSYNKLWEELSERNFASISSPYFLTTSKAPYYTDAVLQVLKKIFLLMKFIKRFKSLYCM